MRSTRTNTFLFVCEVRMGGLIIDAFAANNLALLSEMAREEHAGNGATFHYKRER